MRLGVLLTHPVQYYAPLFRELARRPGVELEVLYAHRPTAREQGADFGVDFAWDVDLLSGYPHTFLENRAVAGRGTGFNGYDTPEVGRAVRAGAFDAFLVFGWHAKTYWQAMLACWRADVPVLARGDSQLGTGDRGPRGALKRLIYPAFVGRFAACLATGTRSETYFHHYGARRVIRSPHFVDNDYFAERSARSSVLAARAAFGVASDAFVVLFAGKLVEKKRPLDLIDAAVRSGVALTLLIVGSGEQRAACQAAAVSARGAGVTVVFAGFRNQSEIPDAYHAADVVALPSDDRETWGLVVNEAMACGRAAIVSTAAGCAPDLVVDGRTGWLHPVGDVGAMAAILARLAGDRATVSAAGARARDHVAHWNASTAADGVVAAASIAMSRGAHR